MLSAHILKTTTIIIPTECSVCCIKKKTLVVVLHACLASYISTPCFFSRSPSSFHNAIIFGKATDSFAYNEWIAWCCLFISEIACTLLCICSHAFRARMSYPFKYTFVFLVNFVSLLSAPLGSSRLRRRTAPVASAKPEGNG